MKGFWRDTAVAGVLALASRASAQTNTACPTTDVCFKLNIPAKTASSGNGDIFFQLSAPASYEWVALGQGDSMSGSNIFVVYTAGNGNVTISPRLGAGEREPGFNSDAQVTLLEGSGVSGGKMIANVRCSSCNSWGSGGSASFSGDEGDWIYAFRRSEGPKDTTSQSASITKHDEKDHFKWPYAAAKGGNSVNPLVNAALSGTASGTRASTRCVPRPASTAGGSSTVTSGVISETSSATTSETKDHDDHSTRYPPHWGTHTARPTGDPSDDLDKREEKRQEINYCDSDDEDGNTSSIFTPIGSSRGRTTTEKKLIAHGTLAALAFVVFFPVGAIAIRVASFTGLVWVHAAFQIFAYVVYTIAFSLGISIANEYELWNESHPIIGVVIFACLLFQPILGLLHHSSYKKHHTRTFWSHSHLWLGRILITLGIINGGLGLKLADKMRMSSKPGMIAYSVVAGVIWLVWVAASIIGERRRAKAVVNAPPKYSEYPPESEVPRPETSETADTPRNGHYAPK